MEILIYFREKITRFTGDPVHIKMLTAALFTESFVFNSGDLLD